MDGSSAVSRLARGVSFVILIIFGLGVGFASGRVVGFVSLPLLNEAQGSEMGANVGLVREAWNLLWKHREPVMEIELADDKNEFSYESYKNNNLPKVKEASEKINQQVVDRLVVRDSAKVSKVAETFQKKACDFNLATSSNELVSINEIAWMGGVNNLANDAARKEWLELKNNSAGKISVAGWSLEDELGRFKISITKGEIESEDYFVIGSDSLDSDYSFSGRLPNTGVWVKLFDENCLVVDEVDARNGWLAGNNKTKQTMEWQESGSGWQTSRDVGGTPGKKNSLVIVTPPTDNSTSTTGGSGGGNSSSTDNGDSDSDDEPEETPIYKKLVISEVQIAGVTSVHDEFVEIFNPNEVEVDLSGWYMQKATKSGSYSTFVTKDLFEGKKIAGKGYIVVANSAGAYIGQIMTTYGLADHNSLVLKNPDGDISDKVGWGEAVDCEVLCALSPLEGTSIQRKVVGSSFIDTDHNRNDFEARECPSSAAAESSCLPPVTPPIEENEEQSPMVEDSLVEEEGNSTSTPLDPVATSTVGKVIIIEVQISGGAGLTSNDYVKLYNSGTESVDVSGWRLRKRTQSGSESSVKVLPSGSASSADKSMIAPGGSFVWANSKDGYSETIGAQVSSTQTLAANNSFGLQDGEGVLVDAVAWGEDLIDPFVEMNVFGVNPSDGEILKRKTDGSGYQDTDDNVNDFLVE
jgi:hypothetical protein